MTADDELARRRSGGAGPEGGDLCLWDAAYVLGSLNPTERQTYERHLATCPRCRQGVQELAVMPGLLSLVDESVLTAPAAAQEPPRTLLPAVLIRAARENRRKRFVVIGSLAAAAAVAAAAVVIVLVRPGASAPQVADTGTSAVITTPPSDRSFNLVPLQPGPMAVTVSLTKKQWGSSLVIHCRYEAQIKGAEGIEYELVVLGKDQKTYPAASWGPVDGAQSTVNGAVFLQSDDIAAVQVRLGDGTVIMQSQG